ncbi:MAG: aminoglycoside phosphotransferase family protein [Kofleriaceae bacterium]
MKLASLIRAELTEDWYRADLASIVGPRSPEQLETWIDELCTRELGHGVIDAHFASKSVGAVFGVKLADGSRVVLKIFPSTCSEAELRAIEACLALLVADDFPAPKQLAPIFRADHNWAAFYELRPGRVLDAHQPNIRQELARHLADFARLTTGFPPTHLQVAASSADTLWGQPHRITIDVTLTGGEWIDARAEVAQRVIRAANLPIIAAHMDWSTKNALFHDDQRVSAILDWDSLRRASEAEMVGCAAAEFTVQWPPFGSFTPSHAEATAFVREYEEARGRRFDPIEQRVINAAADYLLAQVGRATYKPGATDDDFRRLLRETADEPLVAFTD